MKCVMNDTEFTEIMEFIDALISDCNPNAVPLFDHEQIVNELENLKGMVEGVGSKREPKSCSECCCEMVCQVRSEVSELLDKHYYRQITKRYIIVNSLAEHCKYYKEVEAESGDSEGGGRK